MSSDVRAIAAERSPRTAFLVAVAGCVVLLARPFVAVAPGARVWLFALVYAVIAFASLVVPARRGPAHIAPPFTLLIGMASIAVAAAIAAPVVPVPHATLALPMSLVAAVAEEALFRRVAYARLARYGALVAIGGSAMLFAAVHLPAYGVAVLPVDIGAGLLFGWQRWASGTWLVPAATHAVANAVAILR